MERVIAFLDRNTWACWVGMALCLALVASVDDSHFVPF